MVVVFVNQGLVTNGLLFSSRIKIKLVGVFLPLQSLLQFVIHIRLLFYIIMLKTLLSQAFKLLYEGKNTMCMVNIVIVASGIFPTKTFDAFIS